MIKLRFDVLKSYLLVFLLLPFKFFQLFKNFHYSKKFLVAHIFNISF